MNYFEIQYLLLAICVTIFAGFTKGLTGFGLPLIMVSGISTFLPIDIAISSMILPTLFSNAWQALQFGREAIFETIKKYKLLITSTLLSILIFAQIIGDLSVDVLITILGISIFIISVVQLIGVRLNIAPKDVGLFALITGVFAGFFGAIAGTWSPPILIYLVAIDTKKTEQLRVTGLIFGLGAVTFWIGHQASGLVTNEGLTLSLLLLMPMALGMYVGIKMNGLIDQNQFRKLVLILLLIASLNLIIKGLL